MKQRPRRRDGGFTLLELLVTMSVTLIGLAGLLSIYAASARGAAGARYTSEAIDLCEETLEAFRGTPVAEIEAIAAYGPITNAGWGPADHHEGDVVGTSGVTFRRSVEARGIDGSEQQLVWLRVTVAWTEDGAAPGAEGGLYDHQVSLEMLRSRREHM